MGWIAVFAAWTALCCAAFVAFGHAEDAARPEGRISPYLAEIVALDHLEALDATAHARFETVDSAIYRDRDSGRRVWLVLCDDAQPSHLQRAVVVEVDAETGRVVRLRRPGGVGMAAEGVR
ncbi:MAG: hypothetical protein WC538_08070 [Thermoanaerobaculia bacterium]|jgi:hypothetical protein